MATFHNDPVFPSDLTPVTSDEWGRGDPGESRISMMNPLVCDHGMWSCIAFHLVFFYLCGLVVGLEKHINHPTTRYTRQQKRLINTVLLIDQQVHGWYICLYAHQRLSRDKASLFCCVFPTDWPTFRLDFGAFSLSSIAAQLMLLLRKNKNSGNSAEA